MALNKVEIWHKYILRLPDTDQWREKNCSLKDKKRGQRGKRTVDQGKSSSVLSVIKRFSEATKTLTIFFSDRMHRTHESN